MSAPVKILVNRHVVEANARTNRCDPPLSIRRPGRAPQHGCRIRFSGDAVLIYDPVNPLQSGARVWIEADNATIEAVGCDTGQ